MNTHARTSRLDLLGVAEPPPSRRAPMAVASVRQVQTLSTGRGPLRTGAVLAADALACAAAALLTAALATEAIAAPGAVGLLTVASILSLMLRALTGLYPGNLLQPQEALRRHIVANVSAGAAVCVAAVLISDDPSAASVAILSLVLATLLQPVLRGQTRRLLHRFGLWTLPADIVADIDIHAPLTDFLSRRWQYGFAPSAERDRKAATVLVARGSFPAADELARLRQDYAEVIILADLPALPISGLGPRDLRGEIGLRLRRAEPGSGARRLKRAFDLAVASTAAIFTAPIIALAAAAIYIIDPGPVFYWQTREGIGGRPLRVLKLRTMFRNAEALLEKLLAEDPDAAREWSEHFKLKRDPRILPHVGRFLRASSIDELPQLLNVIRGEMSLVGPRPFPDYHLAAMRPGFRQKRATVLPGITGIWQISERSEADIPRQEQLDGYYIDNRSFWLDLSIVVETVPAVLLHRGAY